MKAGALTAELDGPDLRSVRWGGLEIASRIQVTVRDDRWGTLRPTLRRADVDQRPDGFSVTLAATHGDGVFAWRGRIEAAAEGTLTFEIDGAAGCDFVYRRIGICVEHPWAPYVGARYLAAGAAGDHEGVFPREIAPQLQVDGVLQPLIPAFQSLAMTFPAGAGATFAFEGESEGYELEDQRNWTDASFKSYPTPLRSSEPRTLRRGEGLRQRLGVRVRGAATPTTDGEGPVRIEVGPPSGLVMPDVGVTAPLEPVDVGALVDLRPAHLRVARAWRGRDGEPLTRAADLARSAGVPLEVVHLVDDGADAAIAQPDAAIARTMVLRADGATSDGRFIEQARLHLGIDGVPLCGGTASHFSELNRRNPDPRGMDAIALALTPQMHAIDERSMVASLEIQAQIVARVREMTGGLPVVVSAVTMAFHGARDNDAAPDERIGSAFGAAWTVGSVANLALGGASSVTLHEAVDRTILTSAALTAAVRELTSRRGDPLNVVRSSDPRRVVAIATAHAPVLLANLTPQAQEVVMAGRAAVGRSLGPYEVGLLERSSR